MDNLPEILEFIWSKGWIAVLVVILMLVILDPDRAEKIKEIFFLPAFRFFKRGSRQYMAAKIGYTSTQFLKRELLPYLPSTANVTIVIKWVKSPSDPVLTENGNLILCMRETNDQTRNVLAATQAALPRVVCTTLRPNIHKDLEEAMDLTLLQKLASALGKHAKPVFQRYFLGSRTEDSENLRDIFSKLVELDAHGTFVAIFLEELDELGERLYTDGDSSDHTGEIMRFLEFLLAEARRQEHEEIKLDYFSSVFSVGIIILAASDKVQREGVSPYVNRIDQKVRQGCDSIYIIAYQKASRFLEKLLQVLEGDNRFTLAKVAVPRVHNPVTQRREQWNIAQLRRSPLFSDTDFAERAAANGLTSGDEVEGQVLDVSATQAFVDALGLNAIIQRGDCGWRTVKDCRDVISNGERRKFILSSIDTERGKLVLSLRFPNTDPWKRADLPLVGQRVEVKASFCDGVNYYCHTSDDVEVLLPRCEISWTDHVDPADTALVGQQLSLVIFEKNDDERILKGSIRQQEGDPWPLIHKRLLKGTQLRGTVVEVTPLFVRVKLPDGLQGILPDSSLRKAGFELADFTKTVVEGQGLDVVVTKVFLEKRRIRLDLMRNVDD
ncbi:MAG: hypothetical protein NT140_08580 [Deltaproteobacteria bacterium]|nr:hypothetical protein [Deltaproteobacteria bacterium]